MVYYQYKYEEPSNIKYTVINSYDPCEDIGVWAFKGSAEAEAEERTQETGIPHYVEEIPDYE